MNIPFLGLIFVTKYILVHLSIQIIVDRVKKKRIIQSLKSHSRLQNFISFPFSITYTKFDFVSLTRITS